MISDFGTAMTPIAIAFGVLDLTADAAMVGRVLACQVGAQVSMQLVGGALADRGSRQSQMVRADLLAGAALAVVAFLFMTGRPSLIAVGALLAVVGVGIALHAPAAVGLVPQVVEDRSLQPANALLGMARNGAHASGAATAGVIVSFAGAGWAIAVDGLTFLLSAALVATLRPPRHQIRASSESLWHALRAGWTEFTSHTWLWTIVAQFSLLLAGVQGTLGVIGPTIFDRNGQGAAGWGLIMGAMGAGTLLGGVIAMRIRVERPMLVAAVLCFGFALPAAGLLASSSVVVIGAGAFVTGLCGSNFGVLWFTELQRRIPPDALSRVSAYDHVGSAILAPLGVVLAGSLIEAYGPRPTLWAAIGLIVVPTLLVLGVRDVRQLRARPSSQSL